MPDHEPSERGHGYMIGVVLAALPVIYILSIGPIVGAAQRGFLPEPVLAFLEVFYAPLIVVLDRPSTLSAALEAYCAFWEP
jgi:hypothetical protein